ncbi:hypoxanthine phosphoribosyltransferase [Ruminococcaceae bacterium KH2T8]|nr:hypoxanthine phosphoribosyltransferase [Ruminococcaceae bacterium KH2T8]
MDISKVLIPEEEIQAMVKRVASEINRDYEGKEVVVIGVLTGAFIFTADLVRELNMPVVIDFMHVSSYQGTESTGFLKIKKDISTDIEGKHVIIVEDIIDTGNTLKALREMLAERGPASIKICTAFDKPSRRVNDLTPDYNGITVPDEFIIGYGLDYDGAYRNIKDIRIVR